MLAHDQLQPLIDALLSARVTATGEPLDRTPAEDRRHVLAALSGIEKRDPDGLEKLLEGLRDNC